MRLRRTVPFITLPADGGSARRVLLVDRAEVAAEAAGSPALERLLRESLEIEGGVLSASAAAALVDGQYEACLEYVFSHPLWPRLRDGGGAEHLPGYLLENRNYLAAASFRMAAGIPGSLHPDGLVNLLAEHVVEEANHNGFFENALEVLGCSPEVVAAARPNPVTIEWVFLMRTVASYDPLCAALCSGLLETTARERDAVRGWHEMLARNGLLPADAVDAIFEHVAVDIGLGHGGKWREALDIEEPVTADRLAKSLNSVTVVAEMIVRWLDAVVQGLSSEVVAAMPSLRVDPVRAERQRGTVSMECSGVPVWPAEILHTVVHGATLSAESTQAVAVSYAFAGRAEDREQRQKSVSATAAALTRMLLPEESSDYSGAGLEATVRGWMRSIDGHALWQEMREQPSYALVYGWLLENYHYISAIGQCTGAAIASCSDATIRAQLVHHLEEELQHGVLLRKGLETGPYLEDVDSLRPLPTTAAFVGGIRDLARREWKAYCVALAYLQLSLGTARQEAERHSRFYDEVTAQVPEATPLLDAMRSHDSEDSGLEHESDTRTLLVDLSRRHSISGETLELAGIVPSLCWSFLDGIRVHYAQGAVAVHQRVGWRAAG